MPVAPTPRQTQPTPSSQRPLVDPESGDFLNANVFRRAELAPGARIEGPALIVEDETTTVVAPTFEATVNAVGYLILEQTRTHHQEQST